ncbi:MAG TPA: YncE family protein [Rhodanobacteraceae bacterium]
MFPIPRFTTRFRTRCQLVGAGAILVCAMAASAAPARNAQFFRAPVYVTLQGSGAVENMATGTVWHGLPGAHYDALSPDGTRLLVSSATSHDAFLVDTRTGKVLDTFDIGPVLQGVAIGPDGKWGLVVGAGKGTLSIINLDTRRVVKTLSIGMGPHHAAVGSGPHNAIFTPDGQRAYVTLQGGGGVAVIDMRTLTRVAEFPVPGLKLPHNLVLAPDGKTLWIRGFAGQVAAVDLPSRKVLAVIPVGASHAGIDISADGRYVFTGGIGGDTVDVINARTFKVVKRINVGSGPHGVRVSRNQRWVYAGVTGSNKVAVIDAHTFKLVAEVPAAGKVPFWIATPRRE